MARSNALFKSSSNFTPRTAPECSSLGIVESCAAAIPDLLNGEIPFTDLFVGLRRAYAISFYPFFDASDNTGISVDQVSFLIFIGFQAY